EDLLIARIPYFNALFNSSMVECKSGEVNLSAFEFSTIRSLLFYDYTGRLTISRTNVSDLMMGASFFQINSITDQCDRFIRKIIKIGSVLQFYSVCVTFASDATRDFILNFVDVFFVPISHTSDFLRVSIDDLVSILQRDSLKVDDEKQV
ncbi:hypothetical protein PENTCL1PPCAC_12269, partial [Pristionchus entomophagus]